MDRKTFLKYLGVSTGMITLGAFNNISKDLKEQDETMPVLFVGHGSPMNAIEDNLFTQQWKYIGQQLPLPKAVLCISAHWLTTGTFVTAMEKPRTIHDFGGFPQSLFDVNYPAPGHPVFAKETARLIASTSVGLNHDWGLDHGTWSVVKNMYPNADVPVYQLSIDYPQSMDYHFKLAKQLAELRKKGVLIIGSGNMVHNLGLIAWDKLGQENYGFDWAIEMNDTFKKLILKDDFNGLIKYPQLGKSALLAIPSPDHYIPMLYTLGLKDSKDELSFFNDYLVGGSLTMTSFALSHSKLDFNLPKITTSDSLNLNSDSTHDFRMKF